MKIKITPQMFKMADIGPTGGGGSVTGGSKRTPQEDWKRLVVLFLYALMYIREERIREGKTVGGRPLLDNSGPPGGTGKYSNGYEKRKRKTSREPYTPGDRLRFTDAMLNSQHPDEVTPTYGRLLFSPEEAAKAYGNNLRRPFIQFTPEEIQIAWNNALEQWRKTRK